MNRWRAGLGELTRSLFLLTAGERQALYLVLALALLGLGVKAWHAWSPAAQTPFTETPARPSR